MRWFAYAQLVRLPNVFTAMADIVLAGAASGAILDQFGSFACILVASSLLYMAGMVWNDYFDVAQDRRERPGRPIPSGRISARDAAVLGAVLIAGGLVLALVADMVGGRTWTSTMIALFLVVAIFLYDGVLKRTWAGPLAMGSCRFLNVLLGLSAASTPSAPIAPWGYALALAIGVYIVGVTWFARTEARMSKQQTLLAAALVMAGGLVLGLTVPTLALDLPESTMSPTPSPVFPYLLALFGVFVGAKVMPAVRDPRPERVQPAVKRAVLGLVLLDAILATSLVGWPGLFIVVLLLPAMWIGRWLYST